MRTKPLLHRARRDTRQARTQAPLARCHRRLIGGAPKCWRPLRSHSQAAMVSRSISWGAASRSDPRQSAGKEWLAKVRLAALIHVNTTPD